MSIIVNIQSDGVHPFNLRLQANRNMLLWGKTAWVGNADTVMLWTMQSHPDSHAHVDLLTGEWGADE